MTSIDTATTLYLCQTLAHFLVCRIGVFPSYCLALAEAGKPKPSGPSGNTRGGPMDSAHVISRAHSLKRKLIDVWKPRKPQSSQALLAHSSQSMLFPEQLGHEDGRADALQSQSETQAPASADTLQPTSPAILESIDPCSPLHLSEPPTIEIDSRSDRASVTTAVPLTRTPIHRISDDTLAFPRRRVDLRSRSPRSRSRSVSHSVSQHLSHSELLYIERTSTDV